MNSGDLTKHQAEQLLSRIWPMLRFIKALRERMERRSFPKDDELYRLVVRIHDDMHRLSVTLHYMTCDGVGRPSGVRHEPKQGRTATNPNDCE